MESITFGDINSSNHAYRVELAIDGRTFHVEVYANTRSSALSMCAEQGYVVRSVNMIG